MGAEEGGHLVQSRLLWLGGPVLQEGAGGTSIPSQVCLEPL